MKPATPPGRLTLSWVGKDRALLSTSGGGYEWVDRDDPRVTEVRLLHELDVIGDQHGPAGADENLMILGDAYDALHSLTGVPEYADRLLGKVKLVYIDPPFNTGQAFEQYDDALEHSVWLTMMRDRLVLIRELLAPDGSVWVHLDDAEMAYCRVLLDEIFGRSNFVTSVVWEKADTLKMDAQLFSSRHDFILVYRKTEQFRVNRDMRTELPAHYNKVDDAGRAYCTIPFKATGPDSTREARPTMHYAMTAPDGSQVYPVLADGRAGRWVWKKEKVDAEIDRIEWVNGRTGWNPYYRIYADASIGSPPDTIWRHADVGSNRSSKREIKTLFPRGVPFATPKPERLIQKVLEIATEPGDMVLDCFIGSGTTAAVAHKMGRRWVAIEKESATFERFTRPRLEKVVNGEDPGGISKAVKWTKGGGFQTLTVAPSMYDVVDGRAFLAEWATNGTFAGGMAAQLGFRLAEKPPFSGQKGRTRLAVIDGVADSDVVRAVCSHLADDERVVLVAKGTTPDAAELLTSLSPGSRLRKAPRDVLHRGVVR